MSVLGQKSLRQRKEALKIAERWKNVSTTELFPQRAFGILSRALIDALEEIEVLRQYGNKDCTAMADEALRVLREAKK